MFQGAFILSGDGSKIYSLLSHNTFQYGFLQFFNKTNGDTVGKRYQTNRDGYLRALDLQLHGTNLYCLLEFQQAQLFVYDTVGDTWISSLRFATVKATLLQNNQADIIFLYGQLNSEGYKIGFFLDYIENITAVSESPHSMIELTTGYAMSDSNLVIQAPSDSPLITSTSADAPEIIKEIEYIVNNLTSWETNIHINDTELLVEEIKPGEEISFDPN